MDHTCYKSWFIRCQNVSTTDAKTKDSERSGWVSQKGAVAYRIAAGGVVQGTPEPGGHSVV